MKLILSPTKTIGFDIPDTGLPEETPVFETRALELNRLLADLDRGRIQALYKTSDALTDQTLEQIQAFESAPSGPALFVFRGEAFKTLDPWTFSPEDLAFARDHLCILSGLYGILGPMDRIRPYRLDVSTPLKVGDSGLKAMWKDQVPPWLEGQMVPGEPVLNLASEEYASLFRGSALEDRMITLNFREARDKTLKNNSVRAKQARGLFARQVILNRIQDPEAIKDLTPDGYRFSPEHSHPDQWFFIR